MPGARTALSASSKSLYREMFSGSIRWQLFGHDGVFFLDNMRRGVRGSAERLARAANGALFG